MTIDSIETESSEQSDSQYTSDEEKTTLYIVHDEKRSAKRSKNLMNFASARNSATGHPWENFYGQYEGAKKSIFSLHTLDDVQRFRCASIRWRNEPRKENLSKVLRTTDRTSTATPDTPFTFYSVISIRNNETVLTPVFNEIVADDRLDLRLVHLNENARDILNAGTVEQDDHPNGEVICVTKLQPKKKINLLSIHEFAVNDVACPDGKVFWEVSEFFTLPKKIVCNVLTTPYAYFKGHFQGVGSEFGKVIRLPKLMTPRGTDVDSFLLADVHVPKSDFGRYLSSLNKQHQNIVLKMTLKPLNVEKPSPIALSSRQAPDTVRKMFERSEEVFDNWKPKEAYGILQKVVEHGANGINVIQNLDIDPFIYYSKITRFSIVRPFVYFDFSITRVNDVVPIDKWNKSGRVVIEHGGDKVTGDILYAKEAGTRVVVKARSFHCTGDDVLFEELKNESVFIRQEEEKKPYTVTYDVPGGSNADRFIQALYGGRPLYMPKIEPIAPLKFGNFELLDTQTRYVQMLADSRISALIGSSSFGCGKTVTIAAAALHCANIDTDKGSIQIVTAVTNSAVVALINKIKLLNPNARVVRIISSGNTTNIHPDLLTEYDYPEMLDSLLMEVLDNEENYHEPDGLLMQMIGYLKEREMITINSMKSRKLKHLFELAKGYERMDLLDFFMYQKNPNIIVGTVQSIVPGFRGLWKNYAKMVKTVQIDESSTLTREKFLHTLICFPKAMFSLVGDHRQLAPFCVSDASPILRKAAIGSVLETCLEKNMPSVSFNQVFRCRREVTQTLGNMFYDGELISSHRESEFPTKLRQFPLESVHSYPMMFVDTIEMAQERVNETSLKNVHEAKMVLQLANLLLDLIDKSEIAILCFYRGQLNEFFEWSQKTGVYVGSVDSAQGREWPVCIVCTTRTTSLDNTSFIVDDRRVNVALSRSSFLNVVFGRKATMENAHNWKTIVDKCQKNNALVKAYDFNQLVEKYNL